MDPQKVEEHGSHSEEMYGQKPSWSNEITGFEDERIMSQRR
jgi:hypothetical protein